MPFLTKFLVVDDVSENRFLICKTLLRKFPGAIIQECQESTAAVIAVQTERLTAAIVHRASDMDGIALISMLRKASATLPIVMVSGRETCPEALQVGANVFLNYDAWLRVGTVVEELLAGSRAVGDSPKSNVPWTTRQ